MQNEFCLQRHKARFPLSAMNRLYYGDNLGVLRKHLAADSVDLIYLDPPFNSKRDYNLLFTSPSRGRRARGVADHAANAG